MLGGLEALPKLEDLPVDARDAFLAVLGQALVKSPLLGGG
jgi:hypothetical protein